MREASFHKLIRRALRDHYAAVMAEPIPQQWIEMLNRLADEERKSSPRRLTAIASSLILCHGRTGPHGKIDRD